MFNKNLRLLYIMNKLACNMCLGTKILNNASNPTATTGSGAMSGSVLVSGTNITSLVFKIFLRADGNRTFWTTANHVGDAWLMGISVPTSQVIVLPLTLQGFTASLKNGAAQLDWYTDNEENCRFFEIESGTDAASWHSIGMVMATGNSSTISNYHYTDPSPLPGNNFYRIKMVNADGKFVYSSVKNIYIAGKSSFTLFPNPVKDKLYFSDNGQAVESVTLSGQDGRSITRFDNPPSGSSIDMSHLAKGIYLVTVRYASGQTETIKVLRD